MEMKSVTLDNVVEFVMGQAPHSSTYNFEGIGELLVKAGDFGYFFPEPKEYTSSPLVFGRDTDVFICVVGATSGKVNLGINASITRSIAALRPKDCIYQKYLFYFLKNDYQLLNKRASGSAQGILNKPNLSRVSLPLPDLKTQQKVAGILEQVDTARQKRKQANQLTEQFLQSAFIEMFGDPVKNEKGWEVKKLSEVTTKITDGVHLKPEYTNKGVPFISVKDITTGALKFDKCKYISKEAHEEYIKRCKPEFEDILYTKVGATYGRPAIVNVKKEFSLYVSVCL